MKDIAELESLESQVKRQRVKNLISVEISKLNVELSASQQKALIPPPHSTATIAPVAKRYQIKLHDYAWDQSSKFVKFYVTLKNVSSVPMDNVTCNFTKKSLEMQVEDVDNKDYIFALNNLLMEINPEQSNWKVKSNMVIINAAKVEQKTWDFVTANEKRTSEAKKLPTKDTDKTDPSDSLMSLMKNMYDQGDDEMKRTIAKAWHESRTKGPSF